MNQSFKKNREFDAACNLLSLERGIEFHVARNVIRYQKTIRKGPSKAVAAFSLKNWTHPKTNAPLSLEQLMGPSSRLVRKVALGTFEDPQSWNIDEIRVPRGMHSFANRNKQNLGYWTTDEVLIEAKMDKDFNSFMSKQDNSNE